MALVVGDIGIPVASENHMILLDLLRSSTQLPKPTGIILGSSTVETRHACMYHSGQSTFRPLGSRCEKSRDGEMGTRADGLKKAPNACGVQRWCQFALPSPSNMRDGVEKAVSGPGKP